MKTKESTSASIELFIAMLISGSIGVLVVKSEQPAINVVFFRCAIAFLCLAPYCYFRGLIHSNYWTPRILIPISVAGILMISNWVLLFMAFPLTSISLATLVYHINPFIVMVLGAVFLRQNVTRNDVAWAGLAFVGLALTVNSGSGLAFPSGSEAYGLLLVLIASSLYAGTVILTKLTKDVSPAFIVLVQTGIGALILLPFTDLSESPKTVQQWGLILTLGVVHTFILYCLIFSAYQKLSIAVISIFSFIYPLSTIVFDYVFFNHLINAWQGAGALLILLGTVGIKLGWNILRNVNTTKSVH